MFWLGTHYGYGSKSANALDGAYGTPQGNKAIDCSGFVTKVYAEVFNNPQLSVLSMNAASIRVSHLFKTVSIPELGDVVSWDGHCGIVIDPLAGKFIGAQTSTGVAIASYCTGYWATRAGRIFRRWHEF
nr:NlpC/P60 family protein [Azospirillum sp. A1-3]